MFLYYFVALVSPWQKIRMWCMYVSILMNLGMSLNYVVYFIFSTEHRAAFKKQLRYLLWIPCIREMAKKMSANNVATVNLQIRHKPSVTTNQRSSER
uniref:G-protein coupled receptors family 1 profile domain-containing protein n=1 Tax=Acrobeloides nanus TaxID=290746 RepID=A0A914BV48_9BILA